MLGYVTQATLVNDYCQTNANGFKYINVVNAMHLYNRRLVSDSFGTEELAFAFTPGYELWHNMAQASQQLLSL